MEHKMTHARQALQSVEEVRGEIGRLRYTVNMLRDRCGPKTSKWESKVGPTGERSTLLETLADQSILLEQEEERLRKLEEQIEQWIRLLPKARWRMVLRFHYLDGMPLSEIARVLTDNTGREFTVSQIYHFHRKALDAADKIWPLS